MVIGVLCICLLLLLLLLLAPPIDGYHHFVAAM